ncbi:MAG: shikimate dehydrogenase [Rhizobiaceae bacterium]
MAEAFRRAFVCGHPIAHSRSPKIHGYWLKRYGITGSYTAIDVAPDDFPTFLNRLRTEGFAGSNVTIPHKENAFRLVERRDESAEEIGAVNTLWFEDGKLWGSNTDSYGFAANLDQHTPGWDRAKVALVLGAGGASRAIVHALKARGFEDIRLLNRTLERAEELVRIFGPKTSAHPLAAANSLAGDAGLIVNTTSLGMHGAEDTLPIDVERLPDAALVTDIVYVPLETPLLAAANRRGLKTVDGLGMLLHQATPGFERWFGRKPEVTDELHAMIVADIEGRA